MSGTAATTGFQARVIRRHIPASEHKSPLFNTEPPARPDAPVPPQDAGNVSGLQAEAMLAEAKAGAQQIIEAAHAEAKAFIEHAQLKQAEAYSNFVQTTRLEMSKEFLAFRMSLQQEIGQTRVTLARIIRASCEKIIGTMTTPDMMLGHIIDQGMRTYAKGDKVTLRVAPADRAAAQDVARRFAAVNQGITIHVIDEAVMPEGQCRLEDGDIAIDLGLKIQLDLLEMLLARNEETQAPQSAGNIPEARQEEPRKTMEPEIATA